MFKKILRVSAGIFFIGFLGTAVPAQTPVITTLDLATLLNIGRPSISPSGRYIAYQTYRANPQTNTYQNQWILADASTGQSRILVADGGSPILTYEDNTADITDYEDDWASYAPVWSSDQTLYYVRRDNGTTIVHQLSLTGDDKAVSGVVGTITDFRQTDATHALITTLAPSSTTIAAAKAALRTGILFFGDSPASDIDPWRGIPDMAPKTVPHYFVLDLRNSTIQPEASSAAFTFVSTKPLKAIPGMMASLYNTLAPNGQKRAFIALIGIHGSIKYGLYETPLRGDKVSELVKAPTGAAEDEIDSFMWSPDSRKIFYEIQTNYFDSDFFVVDVASKQIRRLTNGHARLSNCTYASSTHYAACVVQSASHPPNVVRIDLTSGKTIALSDLNPRFDQLVKGIRTQRLVWKNTWGNTLFGTLIYPRNYHPGTRYPLIMLTYGSLGFERGGSGDEYPMFPLAEKGFFVLNSDLSGSEGYDTVTKAGVLSVMHWQSPLDGMERIIRQLSAQGLVDEHAVGIGGLSYGSEMSMYSASHSQLFRAAIASNGGSARDPLFYYLKNKAWDTIFRQWGLNGPPYEKNLANWERLSPALRAAQTPAAVLMNAPDTDYLVGLQQYWELRDHHKPVELRIYPKEEHTKYQPIHRLAIYNLNIDWYRFWLQGYEDPNPDKAAQYRRWEGMRSL